MPPPCPLLRLQDQRLDVAGIKAHPWFKRQLPQPYAESMAELQRQQSIIDQQASGGAYQNADRDKLLEVRGWAHHSPPAAVMTWDA